MCVRACECAVSVNACVHVRVCARRECAHACVRACMTVCAHVQYSNNRCAVVQSRSSLDLLLWLVHVSMYVLVPVGAC